jgi:hypothetical protein
MEFGATQMTVGMGESLNWETIRSTTAWIAGIEEIRIVGSASELKNPLSGFQAVETGT